MLRDKLLGSPLSDAPSIVAELKPYRKWVDPLLRQAYAEAKEAGNSQKQLHAALALLPVDDTQLPYLKDRLLSADAQGISVIRQSLSGHKDTLAAVCWRVLEKPEPEDQGKALQAASALALYDPENPLWAKVRIDVVNRLVAENAYVVSRWVDALRPVAKQLADPLIAFFRDEKRGESERTLAASALAEYVSDQPDELAGLLMDATDKQFAALYPRVEGRSDQTAPLLEDELSRKPPSATGRESTDVDNQALDKFYKRQANAAVAMIRMGRTEKSWSLLKHSPDPSLRSFLVNSLGPLGFEPGSLIAKLDQESDVSIQRALILSLGECEEGRLRSDKRIDWTTKLLNLYRNDPDPGIHGAAEWLLSKWRNENQIQAIDKELRKVPLPTLSVDQGETSSKGNNRRWYINSQGQTMVVIRGPVQFLMGDNHHQEQIGHSFAIASKEVTVEQFETFLKENPRVQAKNSKPFSPIPTCPMNSVSWYDAAAYCNWLSEREGFPEDQWCYGPNEKGDYAGGMKVMSNAENRKGYRLPTEAEWEYSCRAGASTGYSFGEPWELVEKYGWYYKNSPIRTQPVGSLKPNDLGLFDLHGNVWEWCEESINELKMIGNTTHITISTFLEDKDPRMLRGGSFDLQPTSVRSADRGWNAPSYRNGNYGFRPSRTYH
jgi:eukaryotic-like serine/threonine-protein kinase